MSINGLIESQRYWMIELNACHLYLQPTFSANVAHKIIIYIECIPSINIVRLAVVLRLLHVYRHAKVSEMRVDEFSRGHK